MKRYFVTGTDTDCGKTYVCRQLLNVYPHSMAIKPIASGCYAHNGRLISSDAECLTDINELDTDVINPWRYAAPISPHLAAKKEGSTINIKEVAEFCMNFNAPGIEHLFIEGAGGLMVPLNDHETWIDFLQYTSVPVVLVVGMRLGCINHALLTKTALDAYHIPCVGWIANCLDPNMLALQENIDSISSFLKSPLLHVIPYRE